MLSQEFDLINIYHIVAFSNRQNSICPFIVKKRLAMLWQLPKTQCNLGSVKSHWIEVRLIRLFELLEI